MIKRLSHKFSHLYWCQKGAAMVEFAIVLPLLLILLVGVIDLTNYLLAYNKAYRASASIVNATARLDLTAAELNDIKAASDVFMRRYDLDDTNSEVIISVFGRRSSGNTNTVLLWRETMGVNLWSSRFEVASLPQDLNIKIGQSVIVAEVNYRYEPLVAGFVLGNTVDVYGYSLGRPRSGGVLEKPQ